MSGTAVLTAGVADGAAAAGDADGDGSVEVGVGKGTTGDGGGASVGAGVGARIGVSGDAVGTGVGTGVGARLGFDVDVVGVDGFCVVDGGCVDGSVAGFCAMALLPCTNRHTATRMMNLRSSLWGQKPRTAICFLKPIPVMMRGDSDAPLIACMTNGRVILTKITSVNFRTEL